MKIKKNLFLGLILNIVLVLLIFVINRNTLLLLTLVLWINIMMYSLSNLSNRITLFAFGFTFFIFLIGRHFLEIIFGYNVEDFNYDINRHAEITLCISLSTLLIFSLFFGKNNVIQTSPIKSNSKIESIQEVSKNLIYISTICGILYMIISGYISYSYGYLGSYTADIASIYRNNIIMFALDKVDQMIPIFLSIYFATFPAVHKFKKVVSFYFVYLLTTILTGRRADFVIGILWIIIYYFYRENSSSGEKWIKNSYLIYAIILFPVLIIILSLIGQVRAEQEIGTSSFLKYIIDFFYDQGVSINVIKRSYELNHMLNSDRYYSLSFLPEGILGRLFGFPKYVGNSLDHALYGYSMAHSLSYILMGNRYLNGQGIGTSYIAELYYDFGYLGIFIGNIIYAWLLNNINRIKNNNTFFIAAAFLVIRQLMWSPRGGFSDIILIFLQPFNILAFILVYIFSMANSKRY